MSITKEHELVGMQNISNVVSHTLKQMIDYAKVGMSTKEIDDYGGNILSSFNAKSAPKITYGFPGNTCISVNHDICHGIPSAQKILKEGDLINIDVSAELNGYWSDNGCSFIMGNDINNHSKLVNASKDILMMAISKITHGVRISEIGHLIETEAKKRKLKVIKNLCGHGIGRALHEEPHEIANHRDVFNFQKFKRNSVIAIETFITDKSDRANQLKDGWTLVGNKGGYMAQHEHTIVVTDGLPVILTVGNGIG